MTGARRRALHKRLASRGRKIAHSNFDGRKTGDRRSDAISSARFPQKTELSLENASQFVHETQVMGGKTTKLIYKRKMSELAAKIVSPTLNMVNLTVA
jgi:hypothetical protein